MRMGSGGLMGLAPGNDQSDAGTTACLALDGETAPQALGPCAHARQPESLRWPRSCHLRNSSLTIIFDLQPKRLRVALQPNHQVSATGMADGIHNGFLADA